jgi:hypothetical protein
VRICRSGLQNSAFEKRTGYTCLLKWKRREQRCSQVSWCAMDNKQEYIMKKTTLLILAASVALLSAELGLAKGGGGMGGGSGQMSGQGQYGALAPDSAKQTRKQTRDKSRDQTQTPDQSRTRDHSQTKTSDSIVLP